MTVRILLFILSISIALSGFNAMADHELHADYFRRIATSGKKSPDERGEAFYELIKADPSVIEDPLAFNVARAYWTVQEYERADSLLKVIAEADRKDDSWKSNLLATQSRTAFYMQNYEQAMDKALELIKMNKADSLAYRNAEAYIIMSDLFNVMGNYCFGEKCAIHARDIIRKSDIRNKKSHETQSLICLSNALLGEKRIKDAFATLKAAREIAEDSTQMNSISGTLALLYSMSGDNTMAESYFREAMKMPANRFNAGVQALNLLGLKINQGDFEGAEQVINENADIFSRLGNANMRRGKHEASAYILAHKEKYKDAFMEMSEALMAADSAHNSERAIYTNQLSAQFEERLTSIEKSNSLRAKLLPWIWASCAVIVTAVIYIILRILKKRRDNERDSYQSRINLLSERLSSIEGKSRTDLNEKNKRLVTMAMNLARVTESLNRVDELATDTSRDPEVRMKEIHGMIKQLSSEDNLWEMFKTYFEQVNQSFFNNLFIVQPNLTNAEVRMAAFILMNLTSKEIAILTNRSVRTVESIKYNLRKKLAITEATEVFMRKIAIADKETLEKFRDNISKPQS